MPVRYVVPLWKTAPFIRLLLPLVPGILLQWYLSFSLLYLLCCWLALLMAFLAFSLLPLRWRYAWRWCNGFALHGLLFFSGSLLTWQKDIRHDTHWLGHLYRDSSCIVVRITTPLSVKPASYKCEAFAEALLRNNTPIQTTGRLILYFTKDSMPPDLHYGDRLLLRKSLQPIRNNGNPGGFDYAQYAAFQQVFHTIRLQQGDYTRINTGSRFSTGRWLLQCRDHILAALRRYITSREELAIAEALLIGYKEDLDPLLVQAYGNTGVVHIIAISGLHLGLIYWLLVRLAALIPLLKRSRLLTLLMVLAGLWLFALLTGASASVLRSAVMFTAIAVGKETGRKMSVYNALAASAVLLLAYNPFLLWDVGFQLSYLALLGIVVFQPPLNRLLYTRHKWLQQCRTMLTVSLAAQVLTTPVCLLYFHQFPLTFLVANLVAVPLSSLILFAEMALVAISWWPAAAVWVGKLTTYLVWLLNRFILMLNGLPNAVWQGIPATALTTILLYGIIILATGWLKYKKTLLLKAALALGLAFVLVQQGNHWRHSRQEKIIVYNIPHRRAIDFVQGTDYLFTGDSSLRQEGMKQDAMLRQTRRFLQLRHQVTALPGMQQWGNCIVFGHRKLVLIDSNFTFVPTPIRMKADIVIISGNPELSMADFSTMFDAGIYVFDASNSLWKINRWKTACDQLLLRCHSVAGEGAFTADVLP